MYIHTYKHVQQFLLETEGGRELGVGNISVYADETNLVINCVL